MAGKDGRWVWTGTGGRKQKARAMRNTCVQGARHEMARLRSLPCPRSREQTSLGGNGNYTKTRKPHGIPRLLARLQPLLLLSCCLLWLSCFLSSQLKLSRSRNTAPRSRPHPPLLSSLSPWPVSSSKKRTSNPFGKVVASRCVSLAQAYGYGQAKLNAFSGDLGKQQKND